MAEEAKVPPGFWARIQKMIDDSIAKFARSGFLRNASISGGAGLTIKDGGAFRANYPDDLGGTEMLYVGRIVSTVDGHYLGTGLLLQAPDGTDLATFRTDATFGTTMQNIFDSGGRIIFGNDAASGQGIARPHLAHAFYPSRVQDFLKSTASAFEHVFRARVEKLQPKLYVEAWGATDTSGTTGQIQLVVNGAVVGAAQNVTSGAVSFLSWGPVQVDGNIGDTLNVELQAKRTAGTGNVQVGAAWVTGWQS